MEPCWAHLASFAALGSICSRRHSETDIQETVVAVVLAIVIAIVMVW